GQPTSAVGTLAVIGGLLATRAALATSLCHGSSSLSSVRRFLGLVQSNARGRAVLQAPPLSAAHLDRPLEAHLHLPDADQHLLAKPLRGCLVAGAGNQRLHGPLEIILGETGAALLEMMLDLVAVGLVELVVQEEEDPAEDLGAVRLLR